MNEAQLIALIAKIDTAIEGILLTGQEYEIGTGSSKRIFKAVDIMKLQDLRNGKQRQLDQIQCGDSVVGF